MAGLGPGGRGIAADLVDVQFRILVRKNVERRLSQSLRLDAIPFGSLQHRRGGGTEQVIPRPGDLHGEERQARRIQGVEGSQQPEKRDFFIQHVEFPEMAQGLLAGAVGRLAEDVAQKNRVAVFAGRGALRNRGQHDLQLR